MCQEFPAQNRFIIAFPLICGHLSNVTNELCPEERIHIRGRKLGVINLFLDVMSKEAKNIITTVCDEQCTLSDRLLPNHCVPIIAQVVNKKKRDKIGILEARLGKLPQDQRGPDYHGQIAHGPHCVTPSTTVPPSVCGSTLSPPGNISTSTWRPGSAGPLLAWSCTALRQVRLPSPLSY